ncbi:MAG TPA: hypothetical protein DDW65_00740 [Firmicutes bacterium]|jgi:AraC-like DNA-binding protein|nr:hypothetical protein [Bacillota bacterium]
MKPYKEEKIVRDMPFPVEVFIADNRIANIDAGPHWHDCYEVLYMIEGAALQQVNDKQFKMVQHDVLILNPGCIHSTYSIPGEDACILVIKFMKEIIDSRFANFSDSQYIQAFINNRFDRIFHLNDTRQNFMELHNILLALHDEYIGKQSGFEIYIRGSLFHLIAWCVRNGIITLPEFPQESKTGLRINSMINYIEDNFKREINLKDIAQLLNLSYYYCSRYFKRMTGKTFKEYLDFVRICEAEKLLVASEMNISEIALTVGYSRVSSFNRVFKKVRGYNPGVIKKTKTAKF